MKTTAFTLLFMTLLSVSLSSEEITKVAVLDYGKILSSFYSNYSEVRRIEKLKSSFAKEVKKIQDEIQSLKERKLKAENEGNSVDSLDLDSRIEKRKQYYQEFISVRGNQIQKALSNLSSSNAVAGEILNAIQYVAESGGYSMVIKRSDPNLLWWSYGVDITESVLKRLTGNFSPF